MIRRAAPIALLVLAATGLGALVAGGTSACNIPNGNRLTEIHEPDFQTYKQFVDTYLQRQCGTLDCHGQPGRAYRMYGFTGFRLLRDDGGSDLKTGVDVTTEEEIIANFRAIISVEPEEMARLVARGGSDPLKLIFLRKPMELERHKGRRIIAPNDDAFKCITAWLSIRTVRLEEDEETGEMLPQVIDPADRLTLTEAAQRSCRAAEALP